MYMKKKKIAFIVFPLILFSISIIFFYIWSMDFYRPSSNALSALNGNQEVTVTKGDFIEFSPANIKTSTGFIFYPGGKVDPVSYAPLCNKIAKMGYKVIIVPMPLNLAIFGKDKAKKIQNDNPDIKNWAIGGHSLGGVSAADYAYNNPATIKALILYASYPQQKNDFSDRNIKVLSIWGTLDGVADISKIKGSDKYFPGDAAFVDIDGGNHGQFGSYGFQKGDNVSKISEEEQQNTAAEYTVKLLQEISK